MTAKDGLNIGMANRFKVVVEPNKHDLGTFSKVAGLKVTWTVNSFQAGDQGNNLWIYPGGNKYADVSLSRVICKQSEDIRVWLSETSFNHEAHTMTIMAYDETYVDPPIMKWELRNALPKEWSVDTFDAGGSKVQIETLVVAHTGFLDDEQSV
jgi:phage tail-like protein